MEHSFYVYAHQKKTDGTTFYIGKGNGRRAYGTTGRNKYWHNVATKHGYDVIFLVNGISEAKALELEKSFIAQIGLENLCNMTDGGEGVSGHKHTAEQRAAMKGHPAWNKGKPMSVETKAKLSAALKGRTPHNKGKKHSAEHIAKRTASRKANKLKKQTP